MLKKQKTITPDEILESVKEHNKFSEKTILILRTRCFDEVVNIIKENQKNTQKVSITPACKRNIPNLERVKAIILFETSCECGFNETFSGAGGTVIILPAHQKSS